MASLIFDQEKNDFREYYSSQYNLLKDAEELFRSLITSLLAYKSTLSPPTVISRLKDREECIAKFDGKYRRDLEKIDHAYEIKEHISDLIGVRIICLYETDITTVEEVLCENFEVLEKTDKTKLMENQDNTFGYKGLHLDLKINKERRSLPEYHRYLNLQFEVQVRTIIQDAWSVLDHKIKYKKSIPNNLKRSINVLAALSELADREFVRIKDQTDKLEQQANESIATASATISAGQVKPLDAFEFITTVRTNGFVSLNYNFEPQKVDGFVADILVADPKMTRHELANTLESHLGIIREYGDYLHSSSGNHLNPYTMVRHALYLSDRSKFNAMLFVSQKENFEEWLDKRVQPAV